MSRPILVKLPTDDGNPVFVNPREVRSVLPHPLGKGSHIYLKGKMDAKANPLYTTLEPQDAAKVINAGS